MRNILQTHMAMYITKNIGDLFLFFPSWSAETDHRNLIPRSICLRAGIELFLFLVWKYGALTMKN